RPAQRLGRLDQVDHHDVRALGQEARRDGAADAVGAAGHGRSHPVKTRQAAFPTVLSFAVPLVRGASIRALRTLDTSDPPLIHSAASREDDSYHSVPEDGYTLEA